MYFRKFKEHINLPGLIWTPEIVLIAYPFLAKKIWNNFSLVSPLISALALSLFSYELLIWLSVPYAQLDDFWANFPLSVKYLFQIGVLIEDKEPVNSFMGGKPWKAGKFSQTLRLSLWAEHLGICSGEVGESNCFHYFCSVMVCEYVVFFKYFRQVSWSWFFMLLSQIDKIIDPVVDSTYKDIWMATAKVRKTF